MTEVRPDWKVPAPEKDPSLLREIHEAWQPFGCALCGHRPAEGAPPGAQIEVHHLVSRAQGGEDSWENTLGLCGELCPGRCHWRVTTNRVSLDLVVGVGWVWTDRVTHQEGVLRVLGRERIAVTPEQAAPVQEELNRLELKKPLIEPSRLPEAAAGRGREAAERRFLLIQRTYRGLQRDFLTLSLLVYDVSARAEFRDLDFKNMKDYGDAVGIAPTTLTRMLLVAKQFQGVWQDLPEEQQEKLSLDTLYFAVRLWKLGRYESQEEALHAAVAEPQRYLWKQVKEAEKERSEELMHRCPTCGYQHYPASKAQQEAMNS